MNFNDAELTALASDVHNIGLFLRLDVEPTPVRLWMGFGDIDVGGDIYQGFGELQNMPTITQLLNGAAERVEFVLSGVADKVLAIAGGDDATAVKGKPALVGFGIFGDDWSTLLGGIHWTAYYVADFLGGSQTVVDIGAPAIVRTVTLSCGTRFTGRRRPSYSYWSDQDQQARFPGDTFCSLVTNYAHNFQKTWPVF